jgi:hypothetical protein
MPRFDTAVMDKKTESVLFPSLLLVLGLAFFAELWLGPGIVYSPDSDIISQLVGYKTLFQECLRQEGRLLLWNPSVNCGTPANASPLAMFTFPPHWLYLFLPVERATNWIILLNVLGAGLAMYGLAVRLLQQRASAFFCGAGYMLCHRCLQMIHTGWFAPLSMYALAPLLFWSLDRLIEYPVGRRVAATAVVMGLCLSQGFTQGFYYALLGAVPFVAYRLKDKGRLDCVKASALLAVAGGLGLLLACPDLLPRQEFVALSTRLNFDYAFFIHGAPSWPDLKTLIDPLQATGAEAWERDLYFGLWLYPPILFACWKGGRQNLPLVVACAVLFLFCFDSPFLKAAYAVIPGFRYFRHSSRILLLAQLALLILAGKGLDLFWSDRQNPATRRAFSYSWASVALIVLAGAAEWKSLHLAFSAAWLILPALWFAFRRPITVSSIAGLCLLPILDCGSRLAPVTAPLSAIFPEQALYAPLKRETLHGRVAAIGRRVIPYGAAGYLGIDMANGYEPLNLKHFEDYFAVLKYGEPRKIPSRPVVWTDLEAIAKPEMLRALDVEYLVANGPQPLEKIGFEPLDTIEDVSVFSLYEGMVRLPVHIWRDRTPLGAAYFATSICGVPDAASSLAAVARAESVRDAYVLGLEGSAGTFDFSGGTARMTRRGYDDYSYRISSRGENFLILSQVWYPGWKAWIDGRETRLYRTNHALLGCRIPAGEHTLRLSMTSPKLEAGLLLFSLGVLGMCILLSRPLRATAL